jgi:hypothetical protein
MKVYIKLNITDNENSSILNFLSNDISLDINQLYNLSTYLEQTRKIKNIINFVNDLDNILHAIQYDSDDVNNYWMILDKNFNFMDVSIPLTTDMTNENIFYNMSEYEANLIKSLKTVFKKK